MKKNARDKLVSDVENNIRKQNKEEIDTNINTFPYQNQNIICISRKIIVLLMTIHACHRNCFWGPFGPFGTFFVIK